MTFTYLLTSTLNNLTNGNGYDHH